MSEHWNGTAWHPITAEFEGEEPLSDDAIGEASADTLRSWLRAEGEFTPEEVRAIADELTNRG